MNSQSQEVVARARGGRHHNVLESDDDSDGGANIISSEENARALAKQAILDADNVADGDDSDGDDNNNDTTLKKNRRPFVASGINRPGNSNNNNNNNINNSNNNNNNRNNNNNNSNSKKKLKRKNLDSDSDSGDANGSDQELFSSQPRLNEPEPLSQDHDDEEEEEEDGESIGFSDQDEVETDDGEPNEEDLAMINDNDDEEDVVSGLPTQDRIANGELIIPEDIEQTQRELLQYLVERNDPVQKWRLKRQAQTQARLTAEERVVDNTHTIVLGPGGSGKTYNIMWLINWLTQHKIPFMVTGTTGNAANVFNIQLAEQATKEENIIPHITEVKKCQARTMHSALYLAPLVSASIEVTKCRKALQTAKSGTREKYEADANLQIAKLKLSRAQDAILKSDAIEYLRKFLKGVGVVIIDEASMLEEGTLAFLERLFVKLRVMGQSPSMLLVGDFRQLPPVSGTPIYESPLMKKLFGTRVINLERVFRSEHDTELTKHNINIRDGNLTEETFKFLVDHDYATTEDLPADCADCVVIAAKHSVCNEINESQHQDLLAEGCEERQLDPWPIIPPQQQNKKGSTMVNALYKKARDRAMSHLKEFQGIKLCVGERVMLCANMKLGSGLTMGMTGTVVGFVVEKNIVTNVKVKFDNHGKKPKKVGFCKVQETVTDAEGRKATAVMGYVPLKRGRAVTINAIEGQTIQHVPVVIFCTHFNHITNTYEQVLFDDVIRQLYVATSRICESKQLHLIGFSKMDYRQLFSPAAAERAFGKLREWENWVREVKRQYDNRDHAREAEEARALQEEHDAAQQRILDMTNQTPKLPRFKTMYPSAMIFELLRERGIICPDQPKKRRAESDSDDSDDERRA